MAWAGARAGAWVPYAIGWRLGGGAGFADAGHQPTTSTGTRIETTHPTPFTAARHSRQTPPPPPFTVARLHIARSTVPSHQPLSTACTGRTANKAVCRTANLRVTPPPPHETPSKVLHPTLAAEPGLPQPPL
ncbi:hypothetical protein BDV95DRAFT_608254 [Massariosphaeria phaeospora]|uniref:Uncharacterized protein n=1 Tax=Massariosphaeria phaeospora TaxID=100035 RepID=A0A7C8I8Y2_9PLEO|nr:hypothetical protein BDV95DRAFT_608254 [Massariosphaeria phaeospora]